MTWYPITPSSSLVETMIEYMKDYRIGPDGKATFAIVQAEDELAAIGMVIGAGWAGARSMTATVLLVVLLYRRIGALGNLSVVLVGGVILGCFWIIFSGLPHLSAARLMDFPPAAFNLHWIFWAGLGHATLYALYDYFGYYNVCYLAEEIRDPGRVIPRAIMFSILAVGTLYVLMTASFLSVIPWRDAIHSRFIASVYIGNLIPSLLFFSSLAAGRSSVLIATVSMPRFRKASYSLPKS